MPLTKAQKAKKEAKEKRIAAKEREANALGRKERFILAFRKFGLKSKALEEADITLGTLNRWMAEDGAFAHLVKETETEIELAKKEDLEEASYRRALLKSDQLAKFLLTKMDPAYGERTREEVSGKVVIVTKENLDLDQL